jgi:hypothetical protein
MSKEKKIDAISRDKDGFLFYVDKCNEHYRNSNDLKFYRDIIKMHRDTESLEELLSRDDFYKKILATLKEWNMNQRAAKLTDFDSFKYTTLNKKDTLLKLYNYKLENLEESDIREVLTLLKEVFGDIKVMESKRRIVGVSKALHFILPDLVMPIDTKYTMEAFYGGNRYDQDLDKEFKTFTDIFKKTYNIVNDLQLSDKDVSGEGWSTSVPKLIDNAIIGLEKYIEEKVNNDILK